MGLERLAIVLVVALGAVLCVVKLLNEVGRQDATLVNLLDRNWGKFLALAFFVTWLVSIVPGWIRFPQWLCSQLELGDGAISLFLPSGRRLVHARYTKAELLPKRAAVPTEVWFTLEGWRHRTFDLPLSLLSESDRQSLISYLRPPALPAHAEINEQQ
jgi:hypothetical protein